MWLIHVSMTGSKCEYNSLLCLAVQEWFKFVDHEKVLREGLERDLAGMMGELAELKLNTIAQVRRLVEKRGKARRATTVQGSWKGYRVRGIGTAGARQRVHAPASFIFDRVLNGRLAPGAHPYSVAVSSGCSCTETCRALKKHLSPHNHYRWSSCACT